MYTQTHDVDELVAQANGNGATAKAEPLTAGKKLYTKSTSILSTLGEDVNLKANGSGLVELPANLKGKVQSFMDDYKAYLEERTELYAQRVAARNTKLRRGELTPEAGEATRGTYVAMDVVDFMVQFASLPPYNPSKIVANGELAVIFAVLFVNPAVDIPNGFLIPANVQLGGRGFRVRFEQINLTNVTNGPDFTITGVFPPIAPVISIFAFPFIAPDPGVNPRLMEVNITADITNAAQPYAAFATNHLDLDSEPGFLFVPPAPPAVQHDIPLRYMIYRK